MSPFAALSGVSPIERFPGSRQHRRLNRGGDRQINATLHRIVLAGDRSGSGRSGFKGITSAANARRALEACESERRHRFSSSAGRRARTIAGSRERERVAGVLEPRPHLGRGDRLGTTQPARCLTAEVSGHAKCPEFV
ncbi:transposase [Streptomyces sp. NPDC020742]|uniref:transposase n=1 Tax=Streptomyces sp. NPDC020742 TaxID=3154897 RepID=UPI0033DCF348